MAPAELRERFGAIGARLTERQSYASLRLGMPWAGLELRSGDLDAAMRALSIEDQGIDRGDSFPGIVLAAAIPPLTRWAAPETATEFGDRLATAMAAQTSLARRILFFRLAALLAIRMDQAGHAADADGLRARIEPSTRELPAAAAWLQAAR